VGVRLATYNIHKGVGRDRRRDPARIAAVIRDLGAGIIALQEVDAQRGGPAGAPEIDYLAEAAGYRIVVGPTRTRGDRSYGNVLLSAYPVRSVRRLDLTVAGREPRGALDVEVEVQGEPLRVLATHLGLFAPERVRQVRRLLEHLGGSPAGPMVLLGDFNEWRPFARPLRMLHRAFGRTPAPPGFPASFPVLALDRIWVRPAGGLGAVRAWRTLAARNASDHLPVTGHFLIPRTPASAAGRNRRRAPAPRDPAPPR